MKSHPLFLTGALLLGLTALPAAPGTACAQESEALDEAGPRPEPGRLPRGEAMAVPRSSSIDLDGRLDDAAWSDVPVISGFVQRDPVEGAPAEEDTEVRVLFDDDAIWVGARMHDSDPASIARQLVRRDDHGSYDFFQVSLDPNLDRRTGYSFRVGAAGSRSDSYLYDDTREDDAWDPVWEWAVAMDSAGWTAEIRIPLSQIRYQVADSAQTWGVNFARRRVASNELTYFALESQLREGKVSQFGKLHGIRTPDAPRRIEVRPYVLSRAHTGPAEAGDPFFDGTELSSRVGVEARYGLGGAFTLDATVNPDFGQVEADPAVINLSAFETFFEERRPFFVEDAQVFDFTLSGHQDRLFHSRRIGRAPRGDAPDGATFQDVPEASAITGAAKLTGRTSDGLSLGVLAATTEDERGRAFFPGERGTEEFLVEPRAEYGVVRLQQDFRGGSSQVGGIVTAVHRELPADESFDFLPSEAYSAGVDFEHNWGDREWALTGFLAGSHVRGPAEAIDRLQRSSGHYYQRPDATWVAYDPTRTSLTGAEWRLQFERRSGEHWTGGVWAAERTPGFEINELGFSRSSERLDGGFRIGYREIQPGDFFRSYRINLWTFHNWSHEALNDVFSASSWGRAHTQGSVRLGSDLELLNYWKVDLNLHYNPQTYSRSATRGGPVMVDPASLGGSLKFQTDRRKALNLGLNLDYASARRGIGERISTGLEVEFRPSSNVEIRVEPRLEWRTDDKQYVTTVDDASFAPTFGSRYLFGDLERRTFSMETRLSWAFTPDLTLQVFAQPLLSTGDYVAYKQLAAPSTFDFDRWDEGEYVEMGGQGTCVGGRICEDDEGVQHVDAQGDGSFDFAFEDEDFNIRSLIGNAVLRWEYRPGSTLFFVWQQQRRDRRSVGDFDFGRDSDALFGLPADNVFIIKANFWLGL